MKEFIHSSAAFWISLVFFSLILSACTNRAPSLRMLDSRAEYDDPRMSQELAMKEAGIDGFQNGPVPVRTRPKVASIWIHPHEMANHDYFWGGWMSIVVESDQWVLTRPGSLPNAPAIVEVTNKIPPAKKSPIRKVNSKPKIKT